MKKSLLVALLFISSLFAQSQCTEIFISEVVEGWSNNKAIEIYNPTNQTKNLNGYGIVRFQNGSTTYGSISPLDGYTIAPHSVLVVVLDKRDSLGTGLEYPVWDELQLVADVFINPNYDNGIWPMYFNGNDALAIVSNNGNTLIDLYGRIGEGTGFGGWSAYGTDATGATLYASQDHTQKRKSNVVSGVTTNPSSFDVFAQYDTLPANTFDFLGEHVCDCTVSVSEINNRTSIKMYPNPAGDAPVSFISEAVISRYQIIDVNGKLVFSENNVNQIFGRIETAELPSGFYHIQFTDVTGAVTTQKLIK
jgi:hypothetical protein